MSDMVFEEGTKSNFLSLALLNQNSLGRVCSKFSNSLNIVFGNSDTVHVNSGRSNLSSFGITIKKELKDMILRDISINDLVRMKNDRLTFYTSQGLYVINLKELIEVDLFIPESNGSLYNERLFAALKAIPFKNKIGLENSLELNNFINNVISKSTTDPREISSLFMYLIGRGKGLTPSGDDIIMGYVMMSYFLNTTPENHISILEYCLSKRKTTFTSTAYYEALINGYASEKIVRLFNAVNLKDNQMIDDCIQSIISIGHTSGYDTLFGMYIGLKADSNRRVTLID